MGPQHPCRAIRANIALGDVCRQLALIKFIPKYNDIQWLCQTAIRITTELIFTPTLRAETDAGAACGRKNQR